MLLGLNLKHYKRSKLWQQEKVHAVVHQELEKKAIKNLQEVKVEEGESENMNDKSNQFVHMFYETSVHFKKVKDDVDVMITKTNGRSIQADLKQLRLDLDIMYNFIMPILEEKK